MSQHVRMNSRPSASNARGAEGTAGGESSRLGENLVKIGVGTGGEEGGLYWLKEIR